MKSAMGRKEIWILAVIVIWAVIGIGGIASAQNKELWIQGDVSLLRIGSRIYTVDDKIVEEPLFAIRIGDTSQAETEAIFWGKFFGEYAINAILYVRDQRGENEVWQQRTFRRPKTLEEVEKFFENPPESSKLFYSEKLIKAKELPAPVNQLELTELSRIDFILVYLVGGTKIYPADDMPLEEAKALAEKIADLLENNNRGEKAK